MKNLNIIVKMKFGSHLYGTASENSDLDFKGVFLPTKEEIFLNKVPKSHNVQTKKDNDAKNTSEDVDVEIYSLQYFIKLACEGQTVALDMLHAPMNMLVDASDLWYEIISHREKFYTKNLKAFVGYARRQASKYGIKGSRLNAAHKIISILTACDPEQKLSALWKNLPIEDHLRFIETNPNGIRQYQVCGKILQESQKIGYTLGILTKFYDEYGKRARQAARNEGIDWKAISHAMRAAYQVEELLTANTITFPLKEAKYLLAVKTGELDYSSEVAPALEELMDRVEVLSENSTLPNSPDRKFWDRFLIQTIEDYVL